MTRTHRFLWSVAEHAHLVRASSGSSLSGEHRDDFADGDRGCMWAPSPGERVVHDTLRKRAGRVGFWKRCQGCQCFSLPRKREQGRVFFTLCRTVPHSERTCDLAQLASRSGSLVLECGPLHLIRHLVLSLIGAFGIADLQLTLSFVRCGLAEASRVFRNMSFRTDKLSCCCSIRCFFAPVYRFWITPHEMKMVLHHHTHIAARWRAHLVQ